MFKKLKLLLPLSSLILAACTTQTTGTGDAACYAFQPLTYSAKHDTPETALEIRKFNAGWEAICK